MQTENEWPKTELVNGQLRTYCGPYDLVGINPKSAPDLLEALRAFVQIENERFARDIHCEEAKPNHPVQKAYLMASAAIKKAEAS